MDTTAVLQLFPAFLAAAVAIVVPLITYLFNKSIREYEQSSRHYIDQALLRERAWIDQALLRERAWIDRSLKASEARIQSARDIRIKLTLQQIEDVRQYRMRLTNAANEIYLFSHHLRFVGPIVPVQDANGTHRPLAGRMSEKTLERLERCLAAIATAPSAGAFLPQEIIDRGTEYLEVMDSCVRSLVDAAAVADHDEREQADLKTQKALTAIAQKSQLLFKNWETKLHAEQERLLTDIEQFGTTGRDPQGAARPDDGQAAP